MKLILILLLLTQNSFASSAIPGLGSGKKVYYTNVTCNSSSTINYQSSPSWIASVSNIASGACTLTLTGSPFSSGNYSCTINREVSSTLFAVTVRSKTSSNFVIQGTEWDGANAVVSTAFVADVVCIEQ